MTIDLCKIVELPKISDPRGNLTFIEGGETISPLIFSVSTICMTCQGVRNVVATRIRGCSSSSLPCLAVLMWCWTTGRTRSAFI